MKPAVCFVMLNPSTADASFDDPTIRRCIGFAQRELGSPGAPVIGRSTVISECGRYRYRLEREWDNGRLIVVNLFAWRSTKPVDLPRGPEGIGPENDGHIVEAVREAAIVVVGWGSSWPSPSRVNQVLHLIRQNGRTPHALGVTLALHPKHPLYLRTTAELVAYEGDA